MRVTEKHDISEPPLTHDDSGFHHIFREGLLPHCVTDNQRRLLAVNEAWLSMLGCSQTDVLGRQIDAFIAPHELDAFRRWLVEPKSPLATQLQVAMIKKDGTLVRTSTTSRAIEVNGRPLALFSVQDITESPGTTRDFAIDENDFQSFLDACPTGIMIRQRNPPYDIHANQALLDIFGYSDINELRNTPRSQRYTAESLVLIEDLEDRLDTKSRIHEKHELEALRKDGVIRNVEVSPLPIQWNNRKQQAFFYRDVTEQKQMEERVRHMQVLASLGEMTAGIAHEIGNPLTSILLFAEVLLKGEMPYPMRGDLMAIYGEAQRASQLIRDLLTYSRKLQPAIRQLDLANIIKRVVSMRHYQLNVQNIDVFADTTDDPIYVRGNGHQLTQVFMNLILNSEEAIKKQGKGGAIRIKTRLNKEYVTITVEDNGPGIPQEYLERVFVPFFTTKETGKGTGLGLSICYGIISAHNGIISCANSKRSGAIFTIKLPLCTRSIFAMHD